ARRAAGVGHGPGPAPRTGLVGQSAPGSGTSVPSAHPPPREEWTVREGGEMQTYPTDAPDDLRQLAISQLRKRRGLQAHALAYLMVNLLINAIWLLTMPGAFYWPVFPLLGWGIGLAFHIWDVYGP